jgi:hypothetical protein
MRVQAKWTQRIDHCASDINRVSEKFRSFFGSASGLAAAKGTSCRSSIALSDKARPGGVDDLSDERRHLRTLTAGQCHEMFKSRLQSRDWA